MPIPHPTRPLRTLLAAAAITASSAAFALAPAAEPPPPAAAQAPAAADALKVLRVTEDDDGARVRLEVVLRTFVPASGVGPTIDLAGAVHIADQPFYDALQKHLDALDVIFFEGVKPPGAGRPDAAAELTDEQRIAATNKRIRLLAGLVEAHRARTGEYPKTLDDLAHAADRRAEYLIERSRLDAWDAPLIYTLDPSSDEFDLLSRGADALPGGEGPAADIAFSAQPPLARNEVPGGDPGIQKRLADALNLAFQLDAMDHSLPNWRNSDMSIDQVQERMQAAGADAAPLFQMLDGSSGSARILGLLLNLVGSSPSAQALVKAILAETLANADQMLESAPGNMGAIMQVILHERNTVLLNDLRAALDNEPELRRIGVIYGAGHLPDLQRRLIEDFGYVPADERWLPAIEVDFNKAGVSPRQARAMRQNIQRSMERQMQMLERRRQREADRTPTPSPQSETD